MLCSLVINFNWIFSYVKMCVRLTFWYYVSRLDLSRSSGVITSSMLFMFGTLNYAGVLFFLSRSVTQRSKYCYCDLAVSVNCAMQSQSFSEIIHILFCSRLSVGSNRLCRSWDSHRWENSQVEVNFGIRARHKLICSRFELIRFALLKITLCRLAIDLHFTAMIRKMNRPNCETTHTKTKKCIYR